MELKELLIYYKNGLNNLKKNNMAKIIDPPSGWMYGFPKPIPEDRQKDVIAWLIEQGYPKVVIDSFGEHFVCRYWEQSEEDNKLDLKDGC